MFPIAGLAPALNDLVAGHVDLIFMELSAAIKLHEGGKARILGVATERRLDILPNIPTWPRAACRISSPTPGTPSARRRRRRRAIIAKLNRAINDIINETETRARFRELNIIAGGRQPGGHGQNSKRQETERWSKVIRDAGIEPE